MSEELAVEELKAEEKEVVKAKAEEVAPKAAEEVGAIGARAKSIALKLGLKKPEVQGERAPSPMAQKRGGDIAAKFIARSAQRNG